MSGPFIMLFTENAVFVEIWCILEKGCVTGIFFAVSSRMYKPFVDASLSA